MDEGTPERTPNDEPRVFASLVRMPDGSLEPLDEPRGDPLGSPRSVLPALPTRTSSAPARAVGALGVRFGLPELICEADGRTGGRASRRFLEFFTATIRNPNTRLAYARAVGQLFAWCDEQRVPTLSAIEPIVVAAYVEDLGRRRSRPTVKQHLAAIRMLFDRLVTGQIIPTNPAGSVRGPKHVVKRGKTPVLSADEARELLDSIDLLGRKQILGLRDRAILAVMVYTFARVGAVV